MKTDNITVLRECAAGFFAFCFKGFRESKFMSLREDQVSRKNDKIFAQTSIDKGRATSQEQILAYHRVGSDLTSPPIVSHAG